MQSDGISSDSHATLGSTVSGVLNTCIWTSWSRSRSLPRRCQYSIQSHTHVRHVPHSIAMYCTTDEPHTELMTNGWLAVNGNRCKYQFLNYKFWLWCLILNKKWNKYVSYGWNVVCDIYVKSLTNTHASAVVFAHSLARVTSNMKKHDGFLATSYTTLYTPSVNFASPNPLMAAQSKSKCLYYNFSLSEYWDLLRQPAVVLVLYKQNV